MFIEKLPNYVNAVTLAKQKAKVSGCVFVKELENIIELVQSSSFNNLVSLAVNFTIDQDKKVLVAFGTVEVTVDLRCERCLDVFTHIIKTEFNLGVVTNDAEAKNLPEKYEPFTLEQDGKRINLYKLVEEEIVLGMPIVALHSVEACMVSFPSSS